MTRFAVDTMLGTLAKWLRALGYDAAFLAHAPDDELLSLSARESRVVLTRDAELARRAGKFGLLVAPKDLDDQLLLVVGTYPGRDSSPLSRCLVCNALLDGIARDEAVAIGSVPPGAAARASEFWMCPDCRKIFWDGTHYKAMRRKIHMLFPDLPLNP
ncbi:MAG: Mut7-C RNAse domain-containing protein [Methanobacteriota archaeon]